MTSPPNAEGAAASDGRALAGESTLGSQRGRAGGRRAWHSLAPLEVAALVETSPGRGLTEEEAAARLVRWGENRLAEARRPPLWKRFLAQISDFTVLALLAAAAIAGALGLIGPMEPGQGLIERFGDSLAILAIVILNAVLGLVQEQRAERALEALRGMTAPTARVLRSGAIRDVPATDLVVGDLVLLEEGDRVAADLRLLEAASLEVEEAALTGESQPVQKEAQPSEPVPPETPLAERHTMAFMGTQVARGRARGVVTATGMQTELGSIAGMLAEVETEETPLEQDLERFGRRVVIACVIISAVVFAAGLTMALQHGRPLGLAARELFLVAVALAVAAIPEGLPAITTIVLALGTQRMAKRNALVRRLPAVETLGCTQIICTDKTGTLTQNAMTARRLRIGGALYEVTTSAAGDPFRAVNGEAHERDFRLVLWAAAHVTGARLMQQPDGTLRTEGDPTDGALLMMASRGPQHEREPVESEQPFTSERRMASVTLSEKGQKRSYVRGAPEAILARCTRVRENSDVRPLAPEERKALLDEAATWAGEAMRVIALAYREGQGDPESDLTFLALVGLIDPPRPEVAPAIAEARAAGIHTMMITGDHPATARAIGREIGLLRDPDELVITGGEMDTLADEELSQRIDRVRAVARATAEHKLRVVESLKKRGIVCAMTGDGVNDAPAVKAASIGVAMGRAGTDVTKEAADLVLADDNYATIVAAVEEGRAIYANIRKFVFFLLSSNAGIVLVVLAASLLGWHSPLAPIQILWINLITNGLPALALGVDERDPTQMSEPPRAPGGSILGRREYMEIVAVGVLMAVTALWAFHALLVDAGGAAQDFAIPIERLDRARTVCFGILAIGPLMHAFNCRSKTRSLFAVGVFRNRALWGAVLIGIGLEAATIYVAPMRPLFRTVPLDGEGLAWIGAMSLVPFVAVELVKALGLVPSATRGGQSAGVERS